jgi:hypothetical protein
MASITLKNIPEDLHALYKRRAKTNSRSLQAEILKTLADEVDLNPSEGEKIYEVDDLIGILKYDGPAKTIEEMNEGVAKMFRETWEK